jgi:hypothetical protein
MLQVLEAARDLRDIRIEKIMARACLGTAWAAFAAGDG